jgi:glyoxylase-like metal-dependent hydrolase (beta-lactamase superfamily II)
MHGIHVIDTHFQRARFDASHLIVEDGRGAFIDVGTNYSVPHLIASMQQAGMAPEQVDWVILTHVHLDHAGGAGMLLEQLPNARLMVHPRGARHMVDPSALIAGAASVYGADVVSQTYGRLVPVPRERVVEAVDGSKFLLGKRVFEVLDTPGHARHHICIWDERSRSFFTGDTFGLSYRELDTENGPFILVSSTPVHFDPDALRASIQRMLSYKPAAMYLTHYSRVEGVERLADELMFQIDAMTAMARKHAGESEQHEAIKRELAALYVARASANGGHLSAARIEELLANDIELNTQGLEVWLAADTLRR